MGVKVRWLGYAFFEITTKKGIKILIDPYISGVGQCPPNKDSPIKKAEEIKEADIVLITHGSWDHGYSDAPKILKSTGATLVCGYDVGTYVKNNGVDKKKIRFICPGNCIEESGIRIRSMAAIHGSLIELPNGTFVSYTPMGFMIYTESDFRIYHMGDTSITRDFELFGQLYKPHMVLAPIGGAESLGGSSQLSYNEAALATLWISPEIAIPMHYESQNAELAERYSECLKLLKAPIKTVVMKPGEIYDFDLKLTCKKIKGS